MRSNGLFVVTDLAVRAVADPLASRYKSALVLGALREDVFWIPGLRRVFEHLSFSHFYEPPMPGGFIPFLWPGPRRKSDRFFESAIREHRRGRVAAGFVTLGRVLHLVADMSCPAHAHRAAHDTDPFEWWVEGNAAELLDAPVPRVPEVSRASDAIEGMAHFCKPFRADRTNHHVGRLLRRWGVLEGVSAREAGEQARTLVPMAAAWSASLLRLYLRTLRAIAPHEDTGRAFVDVRSNMSTNATSGGPSTNARSTDHK